jgi:hypothetical protein
LTVIVVQSFGNIRFDLRFLLICFFLGLSDNLDVFTAGAFTSFVAQRVAGQLGSVYLFNGARCILAGLVVLPLLRHS